MELVGDMLDIARLDTGKMDLSMTEFALADLIDQEVNQVCRWFEIKRWN